MHLSAEMDFDENALECLLRHKAKDYELAFTDKELYIKQFVIVFCWMKFKCNRAVLININKCALLINMN